MAENESARVLNFPQADVARRKRNEKSEQRPGTVDPCFVAVAQHLESGEWKKKAFKWNGPLSEKTMTALLEDGWNWREYVWFEQVNESYSEQVRGYIIE
jgi:hypothetical protein